MNYGEELGYWYLRLNGFFVVRNFVMHKNVASRNVDYKSMSTADIDLLALRPPFVSETIGNKFAKDTHWCDLFSKYYADKTGSWTRAVALIVEVKTGGVDDLQFFAKDRLKHALRRLGVAKYDASFEQLVAELTEKESVEISDWTVAKLLIYPRKEKNLPQGKYLKIDLTEVCRFIEERLDPSNYPEKGNSFLLPSDLIQFWTFFRNDIGTLFPSKEEAAAHKKPKTDS